MLRGTPEQQRRPAALQEKWHPQTVPIKKEEKDTAKQASHGRQMTALPFMPQYKDAQCGVASCRSQGQFQLHAHQSKWTHTFVRWSKTLWQWTASCSFRRWWHSESRPGTSFGYLNILKGSNKWRDQSLLQKTHSRRHCMLVTNKLICETLKLASGFVSADYAVYFSKRRQCSFCPLWLKIPSGWVTPLS